MTQDQLKRPDDKGDVPSGGTKSLTRPPKIDDAFTQEVARVTTQPGDDRPPPIVCVACGLEGHDYMPVPWDELDDEDKHLYWQRGGQYQRDGKPGW